MSTPQLNPSPEPNVTSRVHTAVAGTVGAGSCGSAARGESTHSAAAGAGDLRASRGSGAEVGIFDDLSDIWAKQTAQERHERRMSTASHQTASRSQSPEDSTGGRCSGSQTLATALGYPADSGTHVAVPLARSGASGASDSLVATGAADMDVPAEGEICMFGMSDDEAEEDEMAGNVVASALEADHGGGGAFACAGRSLDLAGLGLTGVDALEAETKIQRRSPMLTASPLIQQLNPFGTPPWIADRSPSPPLQRMPDLELPAAAVPTGESASELFLAGDLGPLPSNEANMSTVAASANDNVGPEPSHVVPDGPVDRLLVEMGDLVCKLHDRVDLAMATHEVSAEELLDRLAHFREVDYGRAEGLGNRA